MSFHQKVKHLHQPITRMWTAATTRGDPPGEPAFLFESPGPERLGTGDLEVSINGYYIYIYTGHHYGISIVIYLYLNIDYICSI